MIFDVETKTFSTTIALQLLGNSFFKASVVKQKEAFVFLAKCLYLLEWKKVISLISEVNKSLISKISRNFRY